VIERFEAGEPALGIFADNLNPRNAVDLGSSQLDFVMIDMEHGPLDFERLESFVLATTNKRRILEKQSTQPDVVPLVRLPQNGRERLQFLIKQALDVGVFWGHVAAHRDARGGVGRGPGDTVSSGARLE